MIRLLLGLLLLAAGLEAGAVQIVEAVDGQSIAVKLSGRDWNRLGMADGNRIEVVRGPEERFQSQEDAARGQVYVRPLGGPSSFSLFVTDADGATYTLLVAPTDMPAETVLIRPQNSTLAPPEAHAGASVPHVARIKALMRSLATDAVPEGYGADLARREVPLWREARLVRTASYQGDLAGEVYELTNVSGEEMRLDERELGALAGNILAVAIARHALPPGGTTRVYLVREAR